MISTLGRYTPLLCTLRQPQRGLLTLLTAAGTHMSGSVNATFSISAALEVSQRTNRLIPNHNQQSSYDFHPHPLPSQTHDFPFAYFLLLNLTSSNSIQPTIHLHHPKQRFGASDRIESTLISSISRYTHAG